MAELPPGTESLETGATFDGPPTGAPLPPEPGPVEAAADPEPEGVVEVQGRRMVPVDAMVRERQRVRETTERAIREREIAPLQARAAEADQLRQALREAQPYLQHLQQHPELLQPPAPTPIEATINDEDARAEARDLELYAADGTPDVARAKRIIGKRRTETMAAASAAAQEAVGPITSQAAQQQSRHNFVQMAVQAKGQVDPAQLAQLWTRLPVELTQHPQVGELVLNAAIGQAVRGQGRAVSGTRPPQVSEPAGGRPGPAFRMSNFTQKIARAAGMSDEAFTKGASSFRPNDINVIGD